MAEEQDSQDFWADTDKVQHNSSSTDEGLATTEEMAHSVSWNLEPVEPKAKRPRTDKSHDEDTSEEYKRIVEQNRKGEKLYNYARYMQDELETLLKGFRKRSKSYLKAARSEGEAAELIERVTEVFQEMDGSVEGSIIDLQDGIIDITAKGKIIKAFY